MVSEFVIKAKFGNSSRRFSVPVNENSQMEISMVDFRAKMCSAFDFTANAKFIMSYVDDDGDIVHLVDDGDLDDVMKQRMQFLKIDIHGNGILPLKFSQWRNKINKFAGKIEWNKFAFIHGNGVLPLKFSQWRNKINKSVGKIELKEFAMVVWGGLYFSSYYFL